MDRICNQTHPDEFSNKGNKVEDQGDKSNSPAVVKGDDERSDLQNGHLKYGGQLTTRDVLQHWHISCQTTCQRTRLILEFVEPSHLLVG